MRKINYSIFDSFPVLNTKRLVLRAFTYDDQDDLFTIRSNEQVMKYVDVERPNTSTDVLPFLEKNIVQFNNREGVNCVITKKGTDHFMGFIGIHALDEKNHRGEIGYSLLPNYWGGGIATEALSAVIDFAFNTCNLHGLDANVNPLNEASQALLEKLGFRKEAHFRENYYFNGQYLDSYIYCLLASDLKIN